MNKFIEIKLKLLMNFVLNTIGWISGFAVIHLLLNKIMTGTPDNFKFEFFNQEKTERK